MSHSTLTDFFPALILMIVLAGQMNCLTGKKKNPSSSLASLMSKAECHCLAAGQKKYHIIMRSLRGRAPSVRLPSLAKCVVRWPIYVK